MSEHGHKLEATAKRLVAAGEGILASDESQGAAERRFKSIDLSLSLKVVSDPSASKASIPAWLQLAVAIVGLFLTVIYGCRLS